MNETARLPSTLRDRLRTGRANGVLRYCLNVKKDVARMPAGVECDHHYFFPLLVMYAVSQASQKVEALLKIRFPEMAFSVRFDETIGLPPPVCIWSLESEGVSAFTFGALDFYKLTSDTLTRWLDLVPLFDHVRRTGPFRGSVALNLSDRGVWPGLGFCDHRDVFTLIPDCTFVGTEGYREYDQFFRARATRWVERSEIVFWRGASTGEAVDDIADLPRVKLCALAMRFTEARLDFGISGIVQMNAEQAALVESSGLCKPYEPWQSLDRYKYHIDIDGNTNSWPGLLSKLHSGGLVFKVTSPQGYQQWYYNRLQPWVHFVPVRSDLGDLLPLIDYMRSNDDVAAQIAEQGQRFARSMTLEAEMEIASGAILAHIASRDYEGANGGC